MRIISVASAAFVILLAPVSAQSYNRQRAVDYAWTYVWNPNTYFRAYSNDCTNFISQCMYAGGWSQVGFWWEYQSPNRWFFMPKQGPYPDSYTWVGAKHFESFITRSGRGGLVSDWRQLRPGDVIVVDWGPGAQAPGVADGVGDHVMIVVSTSSSDVLYAQHSPNKVRTLSSVRAEMWRAKFWFYRIYD